MRCSLCGAWRTSHQRDLAPAPFWQSAPRICETAAGMLNSIGLENVGVEAFAREKLPFLRSCGTRVLVNFSARRSTSTSTVAPGWPRSTGWMDWR